MPSDEPSRHYNWRLKSLAKLKFLILIFHMPAKIQLFFSFQHLPGQNIAPFLPRHVLQHLSSQKNALFLTEHVPRAKNETIFALGLRSNRPSKCV